MDLDTPEISSIRGLPSQEPVTQGMADQNLLLVASR